MGPQHFKRDFIVKIQNEHEKVVRKNEWHRFSRLDAASQLFLPSHLFRCSIFSATSKSDHGDERRRSVLALTVTTTSLSANPFLYRRTRKPGVNFIMEDGKQEKFQKELDRTEKSDLTAVLEHLATVGAHWQQRSRNHDAEAPISDKKKKVHVADDYAYVSSGFRKKTRTTALMAATVDDPWDVLYGDSIHPVAFADAKLSKTRKRPRTVDEEAAMNGTNRSIDTTSCSVTTKEDGSRALLNRCWQRAMHAASNPIRMDDQDVKLSASDTLLNTNKETPPEGFSPDRAMAKCNALGIGLSPIPDDDDDSSQIRMCPSCNITAFETDEQLYRHYYGMLNQRGCCWRYIEDREHDLIRQALQGEMKMTIQNIGQSIRDHSAVEGPLDWKGVLSAIQNAVAARDLTRHTTTGLASSASDSSEPPPSVVDASLLELLQDRLLDRYADVHR